MLGEKLYRFKCADCGRSIGVFGRNETDAKRQIKEESGWVFVEYGFLCPECAVEEV